MLLERRKAPRVESLYIQNSLELNKLHCGCGGGVNSVYAFRPVTSTLRPIASRGKHSQVLANKSPTPFDLTPHPTLARCLLEIYDVIASENGSQSKDPIVDA